MLKSLYNHKAVRYFLMGGGAYLLELSLLIFLHNTLNLQRTLATGISFWFAIVVSFLLQKIFAFKDYRKEANHITRQSGLYILLVGFNYIFTLSVVSIFPADYLVVSRTVAICLVTVWNYFIYSRFIFTGKKST